MKIYTKYCETVLMVNISQIKSVVGTVTVLPGSGNGNMCSLYPGHMGAQTQGYNGGFIS